MKIKFVLSLLTLLATALVSRAEAQDLTPDIINPNPGTDCVLQGMSDNGKWAVYSSYKIDISANPFRFIEIGGNARDISDDGLTVVGSNGGGPAVWKEATGWRALPVPKGARGGYATKVTPDGKYAVGTVGLGGINSSDGCMWDLTTLSIVELPGTPDEDRSAHTIDPNPFQNQFEAISADGRYIAGILAFSYVGWQTAYVYDRETGTTRYIGYTKDEEGRFIPNDPYIHYTECEDMSSDGHYVTGPVYLLKGEEYISAYRYDVWNDTLEYYDTGIQPDAWGFSVSNDGIVFLRKTAFSPYSEGYACYDGFFYSFRDILNLEYGIDLARHNIDNTGVPVLSSANGREIIFINSPYTSYFVRFKEDIADICRRLKLLARWSVTPRDGSVMSALNRVRIDFSYPVELNDGANTGVELLDESGNVIGTPVSSGGVIAQDNSLLVSFRSRIMEPGKSYSVRIAGDVCHVKELPSKTNEEIILTYTGRKEGPVKPVRTVPEEGAHLSSLDLNENPVLITFDADISLNTHIGETVKVYIDDNPDPVAYLYSGLYDRRTLALFPADKLNLYSGSDYRIAVPAGLVTDLSGYGASEEMKISYTGNFTPQLGDDKYIFRSTCDNWDNFLFYEGDHGTPVQEYEAMGFTADNTPWWVVRDNENSTDMAFASHSCYTDRRAADDWVVTRQIYVPDETTCLEFDGQSYRRNKTDILTVYVFPYDMTLNTLTGLTVDMIRETGDKVFEERLLPGATESGIDGEWTHYTVSLEKYTGRNVYIAFVNNNTNQSLVMIDNVEVIRRPDSFITLTSPRNVVAQEEIDIKGLLSIEREEGVTGTVGLTLVDGEGNSVSSATYSGLTLKKGETLAFAFPEKLSLSRGKENQFRIDYTLGDGHEDSYGSSIRNLTFEPAKRVVMEEFTGRDCQFCPQGHAMTEMLTEMFPSSFIPVCLYCYNESDPKGFSVLNYWRFLGMTAAPSARINRRPTSMALSYSEATGRYFYTASQLPEGAENLWFDEVVAELAEPAYIGVSVDDCSEAGSGKLMYSAEIRSALDIDNQNLRIFGVLLENGLIDYQSNGMYETTDPLLGEWGKGGSKASPLVYSLFDHAAKATWGVSYSGTGNLLPVSLEADATYTVDMEMDLPESVENIENCDFVVMVIDGNTGRIINAAITGATDGIHTPALEEAEDVTLIVENGTVLIDSPSETTAYAYTPSGMLIASASGSGALRLNLRSYSGVAILNVKTAHGSLIRKLLVP